MTTQYNRLTALAMVAVITFILAMALLYEAGLVR